MSEFLLERCSWKKEFACERELKERFDRAIEKSFKALAVDIDGTLLDEKELVDRDFLSIINYLLRCFTPVIITTGRGFGSVEELILKNISPQFYPYLYVSCNDGTQLKQFINGEWKVLFNCQLGHAERIFQLLTEPKSPIYDSLVFGQFGNISRVKPNIVTLVFKNQPMKKTIDVIQLYLQQNGISNIQILSGGKTIDIISENAGKQKSISLVGKITGLSDSEIVRIGDQGQPGGNDSDILKYESGFCVGEYYCNDRISCHPVVDERGKVLNGLRATKYLLNHIHFSQGCVVNGDNFNDNDFRLKHQAKYDELAKRARVKNLVELEDYSNACFRKNNILSDEAKKTLTKTGYNSLFSFTGATSFSSKEINEIPPVLRNFMLTPSSCFKERYKFILNYGSRFYSRGEAFYTTLKKTNSPENTIKELIDIVKELLTHINAVTFFIERGQMSLPIFKFSIMYFDNLKAILQHIFHTLSCLKVFQNEFDFSIFEQLRTVVFGYTNNLLSLLSLQKPDNIQQINIEQIEACFSQLFENSFKNKLLPRKFIRGIPEANQPLQNAIYARALAKDMYLKKIKLSNVCVVGLHYGGIELPFFLDFFLKEIYSSAYVRPQYVSAHYSKYSNSDLRLQANSIVQIIDNKIISFMDKDVFLLDDGIFSATSMVDVGWLLTLAGSKVHFSAMSITNNRRMGQILDEAGADSDFLEQELANSFIRVSPFLRVCSPQEYHAQKADHRLNLVKTRARRMLTSNYSTSFQQDPYAIIRDEQIIKNPISRMNRGQSDLKP